MTAGPLRIVHCLRAPVGGLFRHVCDLAGEQAARGHAVGIVADAASGGDTARERFDRLRPRCELGVHRLPMRRTPGLGDIAAIRAIGRTLAAWRPDVVHGHGAKGGAYARLAAPAGALRVYTPHGGSLHYDRGTPAGLLYLGLERLLAGRTDLMLFESAFGKRTYEAKVGAPRCPGLVVHNGVAPDDFSAVPLDRDAAPFVFVGELRRLKGVDLLIESVARLAAMGRPARAVIVGEGPDAAGFEMLADARGVAGHITFTGAMPARQAFALGRCVVMPSRAESLPYVALESAAAGRPIIATDVGGLAEIFGDAGDRLIAADDAQALTAAMLAFLDDEDAALDAARRLHARIARQFTVTAMAEGVLDGYETAASLRSA